jgi:predicted metal-dependent enzyme (double-stranded beta helix superfamily)
MRDTLLDRIASCQELAGWLAASPKRWGPLVRHLDGSRWWVPLLDDAQRSAWLITWPPDTGLDLHDHGEAAGALAVVAGTLDERYRRLVDPAGAPLAHRRLDVGSISAFGPDHVHEVWNRSSEPAVSIHVYAPRLDGMTFYEDAVTPGAGANVGGLR